jgi:predicted nucleic acid-binding protein
MTAKNGVVFLDANVLLYYLDSGSPHHTQTEDTLSHLIEVGAALCTSHHALEEVLHVTLQVFGVEAVADALEDISKIPGLYLMEPMADFAFAQRYTKLLESVNIGLNDCLILQLMLDNDITDLYTYDEKLARAATALNLSCITSNTKIPL